MENRYQNLMGNIQAPARLTEQVLAAARREVSGRAVVRRTPVRRPLLWGALCAAIALVMFLNIPAYADPVDSGPGQTAGPAAPVRLTFGLTAYAADSGLQYAAGADGSLAMGSGSGMYWAEQNEFLTGSLFQVTGGDVRSVTLSLDRGGFYSYRVRNGLTDGQMREIREAQARGEVAPAAIDQDLEGSWSFQEMIPLGDTVSMAYDPDIWYGLRIPGWNETGDMQAASQTAIDGLDGGLMTVSVTFTDGTEQTNTYLLHTGRLRLAADGSNTPLPELAGENEAYLYGVYASPVQ